SKTRYSLRHLTFRPPGPESLWISRDSTPLPPQHRFAPAISAGMPQAPSQKVGFRRPVTRCLGLAWRHGDEGLLEALDELAVAAAVTALDEQRPLRRQPARCKFHRQLREILHPGGIRHADATQVGCHVGKH